MKRKIFIIILFLILVIMGVVVYFFIDSIKEDQAITSEKAKEISKAYEKFDSSINAFATLREEYYVSRENTFLEEFSQSIDSWNDFANRYEKSITEVEKNSKVLKENCTVRFADVNVNSKCTTFKANYEAAMNYYITDAKNYNKTVKQYNDWVEQNGNKHGKLNKIKYVVYKKYIDFDKDGEYFGKGESKDEE